MFQEMRENSKKFVWVVAAAFVGLIFLVWGDFMSTTGGGAVSGPQRQGEAGRVDGVPIDINAYNRVINANYQAIAAQSNTQVSDDVQARIKSEVWNSMIQNALMVREADDRNIGATDQEVIDGVLNNPPAEFRSAPQFQTEGQFDISKYQAFIRSPTFDSRGLEASVRANLPLEKLQQELMATAVVSDEELWQDYVLKNEKRTVSLLRASSADFQVDESSISDAALSAHYEANKADYKIPREATVEYVQFPKSYTVDDSLGLYDLAQSLKEDTENGEDILDLMDLSEAPATQRGGLTATWISINSLPAPLRAAVTALPVGEVSDVIIEPRGFHLVRVEEKQEDPTQGTQVKIADVFLPLVATPETLSSIRETAVALRTEVGDGDLAGPASEYEVSLQTTRPFRERGFIAGLGQAVDVQQFAFRNEVGAVSPPIERPNDWLVVRVTDRTDERIPPLEEVKDRVRREVADIQRRELAAAKLAEYLPRVQAGEDMSTIAATDSLVTFDTIESVTRLGGRGLGSDAELLGPLFAADEGIVGKVLTARAGAFLVRVDETVPATRADFEANKAALRNSLLQQRQSQLLNQWMTDLIANAEVEDFRHGAF